VLISSGVILYIYSTIMTVLRLALDDSTASIPGVKSSVSTIALPPYVSAMFAGMVIEVIFLIAGFIALYAGVALSARKAENQTRDIPLVENQY
jgi:hypothetical protein